jgi:hypothetical protein
MSLVVAIVSLVPVVNAGVLPAPLALAGAPGKITLHVQSARTVNPAAGFVHQGDAIASYKWLINVDDTGNPGTLLAQGTESCLPPTAVPGGSSGADPNYADSCPWPSVRTTSGMAPIGRQVPHLGHRGRVQDRRRTLHGQR